MSATVSIGSRAPEFSFTDPSGNKITSTDLKGNKAVVVFFYPADETLICTKEACAFRDAYDVFVRAGAEVVGVSSDSAESHASFAANHKLPFPLIPDVDGALRKAFQVPNALWILPGRVTYVIDKQGIIRHIFNSPLSSSGHVEEALKILKTL